MTTPTALRDPAAREADLARTPGIAQRRRRARRRADRHARRLALHLGISLVAIAIAYHHSIEQLLLSLEDDGPLAYLGLTPLVATAATIHNIRRLRLEGNLPHWHADWMVGLPLLAMAWLLGPPAAQRFGYTYWDWRIDVLSLALFTAGVTALLFGSRVLRAVRGPITMLALACRAPYLIVLDPVLDTSTALTSRAVSVISGVLPFVGTTRFSDTFVVGGTGAEDSFLVVVASTCSGANGVLAYLVLSVAIATRLTGKATAKARWLANGVVIVWCFNLVRIVGILTAGALLGADAAFGLLHSMAGLAGFAVAVLISLGRIDAYGLRLPGRAARTRPAARWARRSKLNTSATAAGALAVPVVIAAAVIMGLFNAGVWRYDRFFTAVNHETVVGLGALTPGVDGAPPLSGWTQVELEHVGWASQFFGSGAEWRRTALLATDDDTIVSFDTIRAAELRSFVTHSIASCYLFHGFDMSSPTPVGLTSGVNAELARFHDGEVWWLTLSWIWPVADPDVGYERPVLLVRVPGDRDAPPASLPSYERRLVDLADQLVAKGGHPPGILTA